MGKYLRELTFLVIGNKATGKTTFVKRFERGKVNTPILSTVNKEEYQLDILFSTEMRRMNLIDLPGQRDHASIALRSIKKASGIILLFDVTVMQSLDMLLEWILELINLGISNLPLFIIGNKVDMTEQQIVSTNDVEIFVKTIRETLQNSIQINWNAIIKIEYISAIKDSLNTLKALVTNIYRITSDEILKSNLKLYEVM